MLPQFSLEAFLQAIADYRITDLTLVPSIVIRIVLDPIVDKYDLSSVKRVACGAAPLGMEVLQLLAKKMPWSGFRQSYGMTESCCCLSTHPPELQDYAYGNNGGVLLGSTTVKVMDPETGRELGFGENGEILAKGPQIAVGYLDNATETAETFGADGFLHTGDVGNVDEHGFISIVDRIKEMIKVKGHQVSPADLEHLLVSHPDVEDCAVVGIPDDYSAERPKAYIVLRHGTIPSQKIGQELLQFVKDNRVRYKWVREIEFISEVPKGPSGKVLRRLLKTKDRSAGYIVKDVSVAAKL
jgi:4-coumarate--CoA ligase